MQSNPSWTKHILYVSGRVYGTVHRLKYHENSLTMSLRKKTSLGIDISAHRLLLRSLQRLFYGVKSKNTKNDQRFNTIHL